MYSIPLHDRIGSEAEFLLHRNSVSAFSAGLRRPVRLLPAAPLSN
jgi:hypothetical protein